MLARVRPRLGRAVLPRHQQTASRLITTDSTSLEPNLFLTPELAPSFFEPLSTALLAALSLPPGPGYALSIPIFTVLLRMSTTLPVTLWQRRRIRRFEDEVMPLLRVEQQRTMHALRAQFRSEGRSYGEFSRELPKRLKKRSHEIANAAGLNTRVTLLAPPLVSLPVFILATLTIRDLCQRALNALSTPAGVDSSLAGFATTPLELLGDASIVLPDQSSLLPLLVGLAIVGNVELQSLARKQTAARLQKAAPDASPVEEQPGGESRKDARQKAVEAWEAQQAARQQRRSFHTSSAAAAARVRGVESPRRIVVNDSGARPATKEGAVAAEEAEVEPLTSRTMTNVLRLAGVAFIPFAAQAPVAVCLYWLSSNIFTLVQTSVFGYFDRRRATLQALAPKEAHR